MHDVPYPPLFARSSWFCQGSTTTDRGVLTSARTALEKLAEATLVDWRRRKTRRVQLKPEHAAEYKAVHAAVWETQRWWSLTDGMQESFNEGATGSGADVPRWTVSVRGGG